MRPFLKSTDFRVRISLLKGLALAVALVGAVVLPLVLLLPVLLTTDAATDGATPCAAGEEVPGAPNPWSWTGDTAAGLLESGLPIDIVIVEGLAGSAFGVSFRMLLNAL